MNAVLLVDLNNFARYPTLSIGYLASILRRSGLRVEVFAPLMVGVRGVVREARSHSLSLTFAKLNYLAATSRYSWVRQARNKLAARALSGIKLHDKKVLHAFEQELSNSKPQAVLISTYLMYRGVCEEICAICQRNNIPVLIGGPYFAQPEIIDDWARIKGLNGLIAGEVELLAPEIVRTVIDGGDPSVHVGVIKATQAGTLKGSIARPLDDLDRVPFPDYTDFPWSTYPNRIVPIITGRGCGWGACTFCSDVTSTAGRTYRSRSPELVLREIAEHYRRYDVSRFVFTDLKLNSNPKMWRGVIDGIQTESPGAQWIASVHVDENSENGLSEESLREAARNGCTRLSTGLESGSQRIVSEMKKGTQLSNVSGFLHNAAAAGISTRCTMIVGYPSETADDVHASAEFLRQHRRVIERVSLNRLSLITGTSLHRMMVRRPEKFADTKILSPDNQMASIAYEREGMGSVPYRRAMMKLLTEVHLINERELSPSARDFEGVM